MDTRSRSRLVRPLVGIAAIAVIAGLGLSGCASTSEPAAGGGSSTPVETPKVTLSDATQASFVNVKYGPIAEGKRFGMPMTLDDFTAFDSNQTATQAVLAGKAQIVGTSLMGTLAAQAAGADLVTFCPYVNQDDLLLVARDGITSIDQLFDGTTRVSLDSPGGAADETLNAMLLAAKSKHTTKDIKDVTVLESASLRQAAWAADKVDVTIIHSTQYEQVKSQVPDATVLSTLFTDVPHFVKNTYAAPKSWIDSHLSTAAAFCASVLAGNKALAADKDTYLDAVKTYVDSPPSAQDLDTLWNDATSYAFWPTDADGGLSKETMDFMAKVGVASGVIDSTPSYADMVDQRPLQEAARLLAKKG